jgi:hypothetical protein
MLPALSIAMGTFNSGSTTKLIGMRFRLPFAARIGGAWFSSQINAGAGAYVLRLYGSDGVTVLASATHETGQTYGGTNAELHQDIFDAEVDLAANTWYRAVIYPTTTTNVSYASWTAGTAALLDGASGGQDFHYTSANTATPAQEGDWTQVLTQRVFMFLIFSGANSATGGGGQTSCISMGP